MTLSFYLKKININSVIAVALSSTAICISSLYFALGNLPKGVFWGYFSHPMIFILNLLPILALEFLVLGIGRKAYLSHAIVGVIVLAASAGDYYKIILRNDPFMPSDVPLIFTALSFSSHYELSINKRVIFAIFVVVVGTAILYFFSRKENSKIVIIASICIAIILSIATWELSNDYNIYTFACNNSELIHAWTENETYMSKGFIYPFIHGIKGSVDRKPDGYNEKDVESLLSQYTEQRIEENRPSIVFIQLEAFSDLERCGVEGIDEDVYAIYRNLQSESYTGSLSTNIFAGGTVDTERAVLTGCSNIKNYRGKSNSFVWYLKSQEYTVNGSHTCYDRFYNRKNVNEYLGFDDYYFVENYYGPIIGDSLYCDRLFFPEILKIMQQDLSDGKPVFSFNVTYQGHGPYSDTEYIYGESYYHGDKLSKSNEYILSNYLGTVKNTLEHLSIMVDELRGLSEPVVLVLFGDHKPWLGNDNIVYNELGICLDCADQDGYENHYCTDYLVWANDAAKEMCGDNFTGKGPTISANYLMTEVFNLIGWTGNELNQYLNSVKDVLPVVNANGYYYNKNGQFIRVLDDEQRVIYDELQRVEYYYRHNFLY